MQEPDNACLALEPGMQHATAVIGELYPCRLESYQNHNGQWAIGWNITSLLNGDPVRDGLSFSRNICQAYLSEKVRREIFPSLQKVPGFEAMGVNRQAALTSFAWEIGADFYDRRNNVVADILKLGAEDPRWYKEIPSALSLYVVGVNGRTIDELVKRRKAEGDLWMSESNTSITLEAKQSTVLKKIVAPSHWLTVEAKSSIKAGELLVVESIEEIAGNAHEWVTLDQNQRWAIYAPHWEWLHKSEVKEEIVDWSDFDAMAGRYITVGEVCQFDKRRHVKNGSWEEENLLQLCHEFDLIRQAWGSSIGVTSGYRPEPINRSVGGAQGSMHVVGRALDIYPANGKLEEFHNWLVKRWTGGYGDGRSKGFIHIDTRSNGGFKADGLVKPWSIWTY